MPIKYEFLANFYLCLTSQNSFQWLPKMEGKLKSVNNVDKPLALTKQQFQAPASVISETFPKNHGS